MRSWAGAGQPGRAAAPGLDGAGGADAPDADAVPELLPAVRADSADAVAHARAGLTLSPCSWSQASFVVPAGRARFGQACAWMAHAW